MKARIVPIGNSRGLRIPKAFLKECQIQEEVEMDLEEGRIVIRASGNSPRRDWREAFKQMAELNEDFHVIDESLGLHTEGWEWK